MAGKAWHGTRSKKKVVDKAINPHNPSPVMYFSNKAPTPESVLTMPPTGNQMLNIFTCNGHFTFKPPKSATTIVVEYRGK